MENKEFEELNQEPAADNPDLQEMNQELRQLLSQNDIPQGTVIRKKSTSHPEKKKRRNRKEKKRFPVGLVILLVILALIAATVGVGFTLVNRGKESFLAHQAIEGVEITAPEDAVMEDQGFKVKYNNKTYARNEDVITVMVVGVDRSNFDEEGRQIGESGQADTIVVGALDTVTGKLTLLNISRDSMVDVDVYNTSNQYVDTENMQICLAYANGDGKESSCQNTMKSVSRLLYGMPIDAYASVNLSAISVLNDAVGGVEVEVLEDLSGRDPDLVQGAKVTLRGPQAVTYVRSRDSGPDGPVDANNARMARQKQYITSLINKVLGQLRSNPSVILSIYQAMKAYMVTDIDAARTTYLASLAVNGNFTEQDIRTVPGTVKMGKEYAEYHVDDQALYEIILDVFYNEV